MIQVVEVWMQLGQWMWMLGWRQVAEREVGWIECVRSVKWGACRSKQGSVVG